MTTKEAKELESLLESKGYKYYNQCLSSNEDYAYGKSFDITYDEYGARNIGYQVLFRFWIGDSMGKQDYANLVLMLLSWRLKNIGATLYSLKKSTI